MHGPTDDGDNDSNNSNDDNDDDDDDDDDDRLACTLQTYRCTHRNS